MDLTEGRPTALGTLEAEVFASTLHPFKHKITSPGGLPRPDWDAELTHLPRDKKVGPNSMRRDCNAPHYKRAPAKYLGMGKLESNTKPLRDLDEKIRTHANLLSKI